MEHPAGGFLKLLKSKQKAMKPAGDTDPIPEDWKEDKEEMDEAAIEAAWETKCEATPGIGMDENAKGGDMGGQEDEAYDEEEEEEEGGDANDDDVGDDDEVCEVQDDENDDEESADKMKQEDTSDDKGQQHEMEYEEMDKDRKKLAEFLTNEKKRKLSPGKETKDDDAGQSWHQHRNKGYGNGYGKQKGNYQHGWGRNWWPKGKGKGKHKNKGWWNKWQWGHSEDWQWHGSKGSASSHPGGGPSAVLRADNKGGYYLPHGQGYIDAEMNFHPHLALFHLAFFQCMLIPQTVYCSSGAIVECRLTLTQFGHCTLMQFPSWQNSFSSVATEHFFMSH